MVEHERRKEIDANIDKDPGFRSYLRKYPSAVSKVLEHLPEETKAEYLDLAMKWNKVGPPRDIQIMFAID